MSLGDLSFGIRIPECARADVVAEAAVRAEQLGYDAVWFPDSQLLWRDVWVTAAMAAARTDRIQLGTAVTNFETRHPSVVASAARTVQEIAGDRLVVGVGTGNSSLSLLGLTPTPRARLRASLEFTRALLAGEDLELGGGWGRMRDAAGSCPVYLAASGPKNLGLAGEIADGVILLSGISEPLLRKAVGRVRTGAEQGRRAPETIPVVVSAFTHVTDDVERDARMLKPLCAALSVTGGARALADAGIVVEALPPRATRVYPDLIHAEDWDLAVKVLDAYVSDEAALRFAEEFCLFGTAAEIGARLGGLADIGVTQILLQHVGSYDLPEELMDAFAPVIGSQSFRGSSHRAR